MIKRLVLVNVLLTLPFGIAALVRPEPLFLQFGVSLNNAGALVARGYAATLIGYGLLLWGCRLTRSPEMVRMLLFSIVGFNGIEAAIQAAAALSGTAEGAIYVNVIIHSLVTVWAIALIVQEARSKT